MLSVLLQAATATPPPSPPASFAHSGVLAEAVVKNPVPGPIGQLFQFAFNMPRWIQWGGIVVAVVLGLIVLRVAYVRRAQIGAWLSQRSMAYKMGLAGIAGVMLLGAGGVGYAGNHYMQHNNDFCVGCHVMGDAWGAFQKSEHKKLECHDCHRQSIFASARQLYFWIAERPQEIPVHAKVPSRICAECHVQNNADSTWKRIINTAGHKLHLQSDSTSLKNVQCVTCHGQEVHRFKSVDQTCGQAGCHAEKDTRIVLGKMRGQTSQHCTGCHTFSRVVPENISSDSTRKFLLANGSADSCLGCHEMSAKMKGFAAQDDRGHKGVCGTCHNPHTQTEPKQAFQSCATSGCHSNMEARGGFHAGLAKHATAQCGQCHKAHEWKAVGRECIDCHKNIFAAPAAAPSAAPPSVERGDSLRPIAHRKLERPVRRRATLGVRVAFRTAITPRRSQVQPPQAQPPQPPQPKQQRAVPQRAVPKDNPSFSHRTHRVLACAGCHSTQAHGAVTVRSATECAACHHAAERSVSCQGCHNGKSMMEKSYPRAVPMRTSNLTPVRNRMLPFAHQAHRDLECKGCHTSGVLLGVTRDCQSCHREHHTAERACVLCHAPSKAQHVRAAHDGCAGSGCHSNAAVLALTPSRSTCLVCHADQTAHKPKRECAECHAVSWAAAASPPR